MSRINSNVPSIIAQRHLGRSQGSLRQSLERLSSGLQINRGADNPAGLIVSERLRSEISAANQAVRNSQRAINVIATAEGALNEVSTLLTDIKSLVIEAANRGAFSNEEVAANQLQIDATIDSITRIANTTQFAGRRLLNGELDYVTSGVTTTQLADVSVQGAKFGTNAYIPVTVKVSQSAQQAQLRFAAATIGAAPVTVNLSGPDGVVTLTFPASATRNDIVTAINAQTDATGLNAVLLGAGGASGVAIRSIAYGSQAFVSVQELGTTGLFPVTNRTNVSDSRTEGRNALATVNGIATTANGLEIAASDPGLKLELTLSTAYGGGSTGLGTSTFAITGGGALFQLGPQVNTNLQENIGVRNMQANLLGNAIVGYLSDLKTGQSKSLTTGKFKQGSDVVDEVITQVSVLRGRLGAFERNTLHPNIGQLQITSENLTASQSVIRDTDFAIETSELTRAQILVQAGNSVLAIANAQSQNVLSLLGG